MGKKSGSTPDVVGAAETEGAYSRETARDQTYADRPDQYNPFGNVTWHQQQSIDPATGEPVTKWVQRQGLSSDMKNMYDSQMSRSKDLNQMSAGMMGRVNQEVRDAPNWNQFGDVQGFDPYAQRAHAEQSAYDKSRMRLDDRFGSQADALEIKLRNQGLARGDQAWDAAMQNFGQTQNDAYEGARLGATAEGRNEYNVALAGNERANALRNQQIQEYTDKRRFSLGESEALAAAGDPTALISNFSGGE